MRLFPCRGEHGGMDESAILPPLLATAEVTFPDTLLGVLLKALQDVLRAHLGQVQKACVARDRLQSRDH